MAARIVGVVLVLALHSVHADVQAADAESSSAALTVEPTYIHLLGSFNRASTLTMAGNTVTALPVTRMPRLLALLYTDAATCLVGDPCVSGTCVEIRRTNGSVAMRFQDNDAFRGLRPSDPSRSTYAQELCLRLVLTSAEKTAIRNELGTFVQQVGNASSSQMIPDLTIQEVGPVELSFSKWGLGLYLGPWDSRWDARPHSSGETDGFFVTSGSLDHQQNIRIPIPACGGTYGSDWGAWGSGHTWVPIECSVALVYFHEWLHQVDWAMATHMLVPDLYPDSFPACGLGDADRHRWFPNADRCTSDPDWQDCGLVGCQGDDPWNSHVLGTHYDFSKPYVGNHCRDGRLDLGEIGVDTGTECIGPGEAGATGSLLVTGYNKMTGALTVSYGSACGAGGNTIEYGPITALSSYGYSGQICGIGNSGVASSIQIPNGSFFLVVASSGGKEGSYGRSRQAGIFAERPEDLGTSCVLPQDLSNRCD